MVRHPIVGLLLGLCAGTGCSSSSDDDAKAATGSTTGTSNGQTANSNTATSTGAGTISTTASVTATTSSSAATSGNGSGGAGTDGTSTAAATTTGGGAAGNANATSDTSTSAVGGSGGEAGVCPNEPPGPDSSCANLGELCAYEDCAGVGRTVASCVNGAWSVTVDVCGDTVYCTAGAAECGEGEICIILAGGAFEQVCVPNTCETGPVDCDCIEGCSGECATYGDAGSGITITCNTCPNGMACP